MEGVTWVKGVDDAVLNHIRPASDAMASNAAIVRDCADSVSEGRALLPRSPQGSSLGDAGHDYAQSALPRT